MTKRKITIPAFLEVRTEDGGTGYRSFDAIEASAELQARLLPHDRMLFEFAQARLRGELKTADDLVLTPRQWLRTLRAARKLGIDMPRIRVQA